MRTAFIDTLCEQAERDERIWLITGDLGFSVLERFAERFPDRFLNAGVAEQNMTGIAAGLAMSGKIVFTYSIANFPTLRCLEQIRNDVCYHRANVKVVAVGGGLTYGSLGFTHHGVEDLAVMRAMPGMTVVAPGDPYEAREATAAVIQQEGPCYLRIGKAREPVVHEGEPEFAIGRAITLREGRDVTLIATGGILHHSHEALKLLVAQGVDAGLLSMPTVKPLDDEAVSRVATMSKLIVTVEEHNVAGGLGGAVCEMITAGNSPGRRVLRLGLTDAHADSTGPTAHMRREAGLDVEGIVGSILTGLKAFQGRRSLCFSNTNTGRERE